jgi:hypothetical protein
LESLTLPEAAAQLSKAFGKEVTESEIIRWGLDGQMTLSLKFESYALGRALEKLCDLGRRKESHAIA